MAVAALIVSGKEVLGGSEELTSAQGSTCMERGPLWNGRGLFQSPTASSPVKGLDPMGPANHIVPQCSSCLAYNVVLLSQWKGLD